IWRLSAATVTVARAPAPRLALGSKEPLAPTGPCRWLSTLRCDPTMVVISGAGFEDEIEGRLGGAAEATEASCCHHFAQALLTGLGPEGEADLLRERVGHAQQRGG